MNVSFDAFNRFETPTLILCNPGSKLDDDGIPTKQVGYIGITSDEELIANFNETSELNFRAYAIPAPQTDSEKAAADVYHKIVNRRLIFMKDIGYFVITDCDTKFDGTNYKDVQAKSIEEELARLNVPSFEEIYLDGLDDDAEVPDSISYTFQFTKLLSNEAGSDGGVLLANVPYWTAGYIDPTLKSLSRTFEDVSDDTNILAFMTDDMQNAFECIFEFDIMHRRINAYSQKYYSELKDGVLTSIHLTKEDLINELSQKENSEDIYTALQVFGGDDLLVNEVNPLGGSVIYDFSYFYDWMSDDLHEYLLSWSNAVAAQTVEKARPTDANTTYRDYMRLALSGDYLRVSVQSEINRLEGIKTLYQKMLDNIPLYKQSISATDIDINVEGYSQTLAEIYKHCLESLAEYGYSAAEIEALEEELDISKEMGALQDAIHEKMDAVDADIATEKAKLGNMNAYEQARVHAKDIAEGLQLGTYLPPIGTAWRTRYEALGDDSAKEAYMEGLKAELQHFVYQGKYTDEYIIVSDIMDDDEKYDQKVTLYDRAVAQLDKTSKPTIEYTISSENFIFEKRFERWAAQLQTGCIINAELEMNDIAELFLTSFTVNYEDKTLGFTLGNRLNRYDAKSLFENALGNITRTANTLSYIKGTVYPLRNGEYNRVKEEIQNSRNLSMLDALSSSDQDIIIDASGYTGRCVVKDDDGTITTVLDAQVKIVNDQIVFTTDGWKTCALAIGRIIYNDQTGQSHVFYGVNAGVLIGELILANELRIRNNDSSITLDKDGFLLEGISEHIEDGGSTSVIHRGAAVTSIDFDGISLSQSSTQQAQDKFMLYEGRLDSYAPYQEEDDCDLVFENQEEGKRVRINLLQSDKSGELFVPSDPRRLYTADVTAIGNPFGEAKSELDLLSYTVDNSGREFYQTLYVSQNMNAMVYGSELYTPAGNVGDYRVLFSYWAYHADVTVSGTGSETIDQIIVSNVDIAVKNAQDDAFVILYINAVGTNETSRAMFLTGKDYQNGKVSIYRSLTSDEQDRKISIFSKVSKLIKTFVTNVRGVMERIENSAVAARKMTQRMDRFGLRVASNDTGVWQTSALTPGELVFADETNDKYAYYGVNDMYTEYVGGKAFMFDSGFASNISCLSLKQGNNNLLVLGGCHKILTNGADLNTYHEPGVYGVSSNNIAALILNCPSNKAGVLYVLDSVGTASETANTTQYRIQEYVVYDNSVRYARQIWTSDSWNTTNTGSWSTITDSTLSSRLSAVESTVGNIASSVSGLINKKCATPKRKEAWKDSSSPTYYESVNFNVWQSVVTMTITRIRAIPNNSTWTKLFDLPVLSELDSANLAPSIDVYTDFYNGYISPPTKLQLRVGSDGGVYCYNSSSSGAAASSVDRNRITITYIRAAND